PTRIQWRALPRPDLAAASHEGAHVRAFETLKMQPFTLPWPSEIERDASAITELPWPSETWHDETLGKRSREDVQRIARTAEAIERKRNRFRRQTTAQRREADELESAAVDVQRDRRTAARADEKERKENKRQE